MRQISRQSGCVRALRCSLGSPHNTLSSPGPWPKAVSTSTATDPMLRERPLTVLRSEMGDWKLSPKGISAGVVLGNDPGVGVQSCATRQMDAGSDSLYCVEVAAPHGRQCVAPQDIVGTHNALRVDNSISMASPGGLRPPGGPSYLDSQLAGRFSAHLQVSNRCSQSARGHDGDEEGGELHRGGFSISIG